MEATQFACVMEEISKSLNIDMDADLTAKIFDLYEFSYDNYTLLELLYLLRKKKYEITVPWNKKAIIEMIEDKNLDIPKKTEPMEPTKWEHYSIRENLKHYRTRRCFDVIDTTFMDFEDDTSNIIFQDPYGNKQQLIQICKEDEEIIIMYFENTETKIGTQMYVEDFIWSIDNENVTILQHIDYGKYLNQE